MIAEEQITLDDLVGLLEDRGFVPAAQAGNSRWYLHRRSGAEISLPVTPLKRMVPVNVASVRFQLDQFGLMERHEFDEWMWRLAIARKDRREPTGAEKTAASEKTAAPEKRSVAGKADAADGRQASAAHGGASRKTAKRPARQKAQSPRR